jgi:hypothetical protein
MPRVEEQPEANSDDGDLKVAATKPLSVAGACVKRVRELCRMHKQYFLTSE